MGLRKTNLTRNDDDDDDVNEDDNDINDDKDNGGGDDLTMTSTTHLSRNLDSVKSPRGSPE